MSVPAGQRKENRLEVVMQARELAVYTLRITSNKNVFIPDYDERSQLDEVDMFRLQVVLLV